jgi:hypothetical protein
MEIDNDNFTKHGNEFRDILYMMKLRMKLLVFI